MSKPGMYRLFCGEADLYAPNTLTDEDVTVEMIDDISSRFGVHCQEFINEIRAMYPYIAWEMEIDS